MSTGLIIAASPEADIDYIAQIYRRLVKPLVICADGGMGKARRLGIEPHWLLGDMDSGGRVGDAPTIEFPAEKDYSDSEACLERALELGCQEIYISGATGGRLDHLLCNLHLLELARSAGAKAYLVDAWNQVQLAENGAFMVPPPYKYFSLAPIDSVLEGVSISGAKYPLNQARVERARSSLTLSNESLGGQVALQVDRGQCFLIFSL